MSQSFQMSTKTLKAKALLEPLAPLPQLDPRSHSLDKSSKPKALLGVYIILLMLNIVKVDSTTECIK